MKTKKSHTLQRSLSASLALIPTLVGVGSAFATEGTSTWRPANQIDYTIRVHRDAEGVARTTVAKMILEGPKTKILLPSSNSEIECVLSRRKDSDWLNREEISLASQSPLVTLSETGDQVFRLEREGDEVQCSYLGLEADKEIQLIAAYERNNADAMSDDEGKVQRLSVLIEKLKNTTVIDESTLIKIKEVGLDSQLARSETLWGNSLVGIEMPFKSGEVVEVRDIQGTLLFKTGAFESDYKNIGPDGMTSSKVDSDILRDIPKDRGAPFSLFCGVYAAPREARDPEKVPSQGLQESLTSSTWASRNMRLTHFAKNSGTLRCFVNGPKSDYKSIKGAFNLSVVQYQVENVLGEAKKLLDDREKAIALANASRNRMEKELVQSEIRSWVDQASNSFVRQQMLMSELRALRDTRNALLVSVQDLRGEWLALQEELRIVGESGEFGEKERAAKILDLSEAIAATSKEIEDKGQEIKNVEAKLNQIRTKAQELAKEITERAKKREEEFRLALQKAEAERVAEIGRKNAELEQARTDLLFSPTTRVSFTPKSVRLVLSRSPRVETVRNKEVKYTTFRWSALDQYVSLDSDKGELSMASKRVTPYELFNSTERYDRVRDTSDIVVDVCVADFPKIEKILTKRIQAVQSGRDKTGAYLASSMKTWAKKYPKCRKIRTGESTSALFVRQADAGFEHCHMLYGDGSQIPHSVAATYVWSDGQDETLKRTIRYDQRSASELRFLADSFNAHADRVGGSLQCVVKSNLEFTEAKQGE